MTRPSSAMRRVVVERAHFRCEYCLVHQDLVASAHHVDHVIAEKHGGDTSVNNLALSCTLCNRRKGSDISSIDPQTGALVPLFNPRLQAWGEHFRIDRVRIVGVTPEGRTTVEFLRLNAYERLMERAEWIRAGRFGPGT